MKRKEAEQLLDHYDSCLDLEALLLKVDHEEIESTYQRITEDT
jgi:hypothetical protein